MHKLLLADDSVTIQRVIELTFSGEDIQVVAVNDGEQAIARIPSERPDIVLADIGMPKRGGYDVAAFVKGRPDFEHIPVLLLAGAFEPVDQARAEQVRCDGVLIKPFEPRQVIERVRELLDGVKGTPAQATADVPRPVERLSPRAEPQLASSVPLVPPVMVAPATADESPRAPASTAAMPAAAPADDPVVSPVVGDSSFETDLALDEYFESLNSAFESVVPVRTPNAIETASPVAPPTAARDAAVEPAAVVLAERHRRRGDLLDDYFDRLSTAFEPARPAGATDPLPETFDELLDDPQVPTIEALVGVASGAESTGQTAHGRATVTVARATGHTDGARNPIVAALEAMLRVEEPAPAAQPTLPGLPSLDSSTEPAARSDLAEAVARRVLERLVPEITATVQRLVREEVDRVSKTH